MRNLIVITIIFFSASAQIKSDTLRIGTLEDPAELISPYSNFVLNKDFFIEQSYGRGLYYFEENQLVSTDVESIRFDDDKVIILLNPKSRFSVEDILFTFDHYREYYKQSANPKYFFFSTVSELQTTNGGFSFRMAGKKIGLFNKIYLTYPILNSADIRQLEANSQLIKSQYSQYDVRQLSNSNAIQISSKQQQSNRVNVVEIVRYDDESNFFTNAFTDNIGFFHFSEFPEFVKSSRDAISSRLSIKTINQNKNEIIFMGV
ncbi:MAG: hypothetical protein KDD94_10085, partial [Calditrichaeota bacterium]|nr:hypothetical protein [Calditrichota bacterium]